jgi:4-diphosphocytidyl-2-C-methyl-D-erythritol kinase
MRDKMLPSVWPAPAKLNLFLHITGRRPDGYHELQTVFQFIDYCDELRFTLRGDANICRVQGIDTVPEAEDLTVRAARLLQQASGCCQGVDIAIEKRLPMGGGLGGGSSDAATTLVALNQLWETGMSEDQLAALGLQLGADVPVFVRGRAAWAEGVGEHLTPLDLPPSWFVVLVPQVHIATAGLFGDPQLTRDVPALKIRDFLAPANPQDWCNVFEPLVRKAYPAVAEALDWLEQQAGMARLTGTGACVFAHFEDESAARAVAARGPWQAVVARGCNLSPLHRVLNAAVDGAAEDQ